VEVLGPKISSTQSNSSDLCVSVNTINAEINLQQSGGTTMSVICLFIIIVTLCALRHEVV